MFELVSLGAFPPRQGGDQAAHAVRFARLDPHIYLDFTRKTGRCPHLGRIDFGGGLLLCDGSWLLGFPTLVLLCSGVGLLRHPIKTHLKLNRLESRPVDPSTGVRSDHIVWL